MTIELEDGKPPEWMVALENKQKRHKLAHEIGAGAPCLNCNDGCLGLDLHFWRKICRNCKCKKEVHDVKEENSYEQFEILFGDNLKSSDRVKQISLDLKFKLDDILNTKEAQFKDAKDHKPDNDLVFDWIPTDVPANLASEYLQQLPLEKLPITGSAGAMFRKQQLQKQMPLHDFKVNNCHDLTDEEAKAFTEYVDNLKSNAVGKGQITKIHNGGNTNDHPNQILKLPAFSANLNSIPKPFKPTCAVLDNHNDDESFPPPPPQLLHPEPCLTLKTPSAFVPYKQLNELLPKSYPQTATSEAPYAIQNVNYNKQKESSIPVSGIAAQYAQMNLTDRSNNTIDTENNNWYASNDEDSLENLKPSDIIRKLNSKPSQITNGHTKNIPNNKNISPLNDVTKNVDGRFLKLGTPEQFQALSSYIPRTPQVSNTLVNHGPKHSAIIESKNSKVHFGPNTIYVDNTIDPCQQVGRVDQSCIVQNCHQCKVPVYPGQVVVLAERAGVEVIWHPQCFVCFSCQELLVDLVYFFHKGEVYCGRHYADVLKIPRCYACDELIFLKEYTVAEGQSFHVKHFCCFECDIPLAGMQYVPKDNNPVCLSCYEAKYGKKCHCCDKMIKTGDSRVGWKELSWHATPSCFKCVQCSKSLLGGKFVVKNDNPLCSKECMLKL